MSMLSRRRDCLHSYDRIGSGGKVVIDFGICDKSPTPRRTQKSRRTHDSGPSRPLTGSLCSDYEDKSW